MLLDPKIPVRFPPPGQEGVAEEARAAYLLKVPTLPEETQLHRAVAAAGGRQHGLLRRLAAIRAGVRAVFPDGDDGGLLARIEDHEAALREFHEVGTGGDQQELKALIERIAEGGETAEEAERLLLEAGHGPLARIAGDMAVYPEILGREAARLFVMGWENIPGECRRGKFGLEEESLRRIPALHRLLIGQEIERLLRPPDTLVKN